MTDHPTPTDDDLSLALDGEADAELLARIHADPAARRRLEELRSARALVRDADVTPLGDDVADQLIATAIETPIAPARAASSGGRRATPWLVAAAVIVLMAIGLSLVWAGRSSDEDQASASKSASESTALDSASDTGGNPDSSFSGGDATGGSSAESLGMHGAPTTVAPSTGSTTADLPVLYLGSYPSGAKLREATATSFADAWKASGSPLAFDTDELDTQGSSNARAAQEPPPDTAIERCGDQLQVTLSMKAGPIQTGYATVDGQPVLVYEFATASARSDAPTTLVAAVGVDACDEVVIFER
jgi:hypothetical protein